MLFPDLNDDTTNYIKKDIRGSIYDRNGNIIATSIESISLSINPNKIKNKKELANKLGLILDLDIKKIEKKLLSTSKFIWIKRNISPVEYQEIINLGEINIKAHKEFKRIYLSFSSLLFLSVFHEFLRKTHVFLNVFHENLRETHIFQPSS